MSRWHSYINSTRAILSLYKGEEPFASFSRKYFAQHRKFGSTDRKWINHLCYCYFRLGKALGDSPAEERIMTGLFLCSGEPNDLLNALRPEWNEKTGLAIPEKIAMIGSGLAIETIFPWAHELSTGIDKNEFILSHFRQPDLFLRLRPGNEKKVQQKLQEAGIGFRTVSGTCIALSNSSKVDKVIELDKEAVVQDYSSQRVGEFIQLAVGSQQSAVGSQQSAVGSQQSARLNPQTSLKVWDCCSGSGGKSLLLYDIYKDIELTVSDMRESILINLKKRFNKAGINTFNFFIADLTNSQSLNPNSQFPIPNSQFLIPGSPFQLIIADVPCSGSGTWGRSPEQLTYFEQKKIGEYADLQKKIVSNIIPFLQPGGWLLYITCSVFQKENEQVVDFVKEKFHFQKLKMEWLTGYDKKADTMFAALLQLPVDQGLL